MAERNAEIPGDRRIDFRIGVNLGDVIIEGDDIYGDGVNVASRLETLAEPGGICISGTVHESITGKIDHAFADSGERTVKNIARPIHVWSWAVNGAPMNANSTSSETFARAEKPSIAVLPFKNMSGDPEQDYFSDGITADVITALGRFPTLSVVARTSTFVYRNRVADDGGAGRALGASYLLEGSLRRSANRIRLTTNLTDTRDGRQIWAERYDRELADIFDLQDELVHTVVATLSGKLEARQIEDASRKTTDNLDAYDLYLRALQYERRYDMAHFLEGRTMLRKAVELDPTFARAHALLAYYTFGTGWFANVSDQDLNDEALELAKRAVELDPDDSDCYAKLGITYLNRDEHEQAGFYLEKARSLNPHDPNVWGHLAWYLTSIGQHETALEYLDRYEAVEPYPPSWHWEIKGEAYFGLQRFQDAIIAYERMVEPNFWDFGYLAACYGQLGKKEKAQALWAELRRLCPNDDFATAWFPDALCDQATIDLYVEGLKKAGVMT
jgi:TolB-like protein